MPKHQEFERHEIIDTGTSKLVTVQGNAHLLELLHLCLKDIEGKLLEKPTIVVYGKECHQQRNVAFFSDTVPHYTYSNKAMLAQPLTENLTNLMNTINTLMNVDVNGILVNEYENGSNYISQHSDDEKELTANSTVITVSLGAERELRIVHKPTHKQILRIPLKPGLIYSMQGKFQKEFTHGIPFTKLPVGRRVSFTFRTHAIKI